MIFYLSVDICQLNLTDLIQYFNHEIHSLATENVYNFLHDGVISLKKSRFISICNSSYILWKSAK